ncbi:MAG: acyltransferase [Oscillospiraceae bacterium]|nr:acyltransferase [Oscillospiraceae bacterium]
MESIKGISSENTLCFRGLLACCVLMSHVLALPAVYAFIPSSVIDALGYFSVACFFFLSGYGLTAQYGKHGAQYIKGLPRNRIFPFYILICCLTAVYSMLTLLTDNEQITLKLIIQSLCFGNDTIISKGWYLQVSLICYLAYYFVFRIISHGRGRLICGCVLLIIYITFCCVRDFSVSYYQTVPNFLLGCVWNQTVGDRIKKSTENCDHCWNSFTFNSLGVEYICVFCKYSTSRVGDSNFCRTCCICVGKVQF